MRYLLKTGHLVQKVDVSTEKQNHWRDGNKDKRWDTRE